jgi:hypothetical protein
MWRRSDGGVARNARMVTGGDKRNNGATDGATTPAILQIWQKVHPSPCRSLAGGTSPF